MYSSAISILKYQSPSLLKSMRIQSVRERWDIWAWSMMLWAQSPPPPRLTFSIVFETTYAPSLSGSIANVPLHGMCITAIIFSVDGVWTLLWTASQCHKISHFTHLKAQKSKKMRFSSIYEPLYHQTNVLTTVKKPSTLLTGIAISCNSPPSREESSIV